MSTRHEPRTTGIPAEPCARCGRLLDAATAVGDDLRATPSPGDATICAYCGELYVLDAVLNLRPPTEAEILEMPLDLLSRAQRLRRKAFGRRGS